MHNGQRHREIEGGTSRPVEVVTSVPVTVPLKTEYEIEIIQNRSIISMAIWSLISLLSIDCNL